MSWAKEFVEINKAIHDRSSFDCGEAELNTFLKTHAVKHMEAGISTTMLLPASTQLPNGKYPICAFYTVAPSSIHREDLPPQYKKKLPFYPVPVFLIAQLAVHSDYKKQGLGKITLIKALEFLYNIHSHMRAYAVIVDCLNEDIENFYSKYGFQILYRHEDRARMFLPMDTVVSIFE